DLARNLGPVGSSTPLNLVVSLSHPDPAGEQAAYTAMYDPASAAYHHFLTPAQYAARFGVTAATVGATETWLRGGGLQVTQVSGAGDLVQVSGTAAAVTRLFRTPLDWFTYQGKRFLANTAPPAIPAALPVATIVGLNTLQQFSPADRATPAAGGGTFSGEFNERDLWKVYDEPDSNYGQGQSLGIFGEGDTDPVVANLRVFEGRQHLPQVPVRVVHTEPGSYGDVSGELEWNLDSQASTGMAPMAHQLVYYFASSLFDADILTAFSSWASDPNGPLQASASFGECETDPLNSLVGSPLLDPKVPFGQGLGDNLELAAEPVLRQATMEGRTLFASAGDTAGLCIAVALPVIGGANGVLPGTAPFQSFPAVSPYVVGVGGTVVTSNAAKTQRVSEVSWTYTGGGPSAFVAAPAYQRGIAGLTQTCSTDPNGKAYPSGTLCRGVPDLAADSSGGVPLVSSNSTYDVVEDMVDAGEGGTSLSAPLADGMWTRIQAAAPHGGLGFANESLYRLARTAHYHRDFYDVTASEFGLGNVTNQPGPGYDYTSGLGVMDVAHLMQDLDGRLTPTVPVAPPAVAPNPLACPNVITSPAGNSIDQLTMANDAAVDFTAGQLRLSPDHTALLAGLSGPGLSPGLVPEAVGGTTYTVYWTYAGKTYFAEAQVGPPEVVSYVDGHVDPTNGAVVDHTISGTFANGRLSMTVPLKDVGNPPVGARLQYPYGVTSGFVTGVPGVVGILQITADAGSHADYQVGMRCPS
ncbi:MAG TPA: protease pro-enzyme activation domain-containing protein, partial [Acidimicrobiales bacterium]